MLEQRIDFMESFEFFYPRMFKSWPLVDLEFMARPNLLFGLDMGRLYGFAEDFGAQVNRI